MNIKKWQSHLILPFDLSTSSDVGGRGPKACETRDKVRSTRELDRSDSARIPDTGGKVARNYLRAVVSRTRHSRRGSTTLEPGNKCSSRFAKACTALHERRIHQFLFFLFFFYLQAGFSVDRSTVFAFRKKTADGRHDTPRRARKCFLSLLRRTRNSRDIKRGIQQVPRLTGSESLPFIETSVFAFKLERRWRSFADFSLPSRLFSIKKKVQRKFERVQTVTATKANHKQSLRRSELSTERTAQQPLIKWKKKKKSAQTTFTPTSLFLKPSLKLRLQERVCKEVATSPAWRTNDAIIANSSRQSGLKVRSLGVKNSGKLAPRARNGTFASATDIYG